MVQLFEKPLVWGGEGGGGNQENTARIKKIQIKY
jgi:hypothetical protein